MDVAVMYSGGKDSTLAIQHCLDRGWNIKYLLSVKPSRNDCYLFHFATVEFTKELSSILGLNHIYTTCDVADPQQEAAIIKNIVADNLVDAIVLGGVGLQETQIKVLRDTLFNLGVEVFATHTGQDHGQLVQEMIAQGYDIRITQIAADGLTKEWLGKRIDSHSFKELQKLSETYGFHIGAEGGHYDTLVVDAPFFNKRLDIVESETVMESECSGHLLVKKAAIVEKTSIPTIH